VDKTNFDHADLSLAALAEVPLGACSFDGALGLTPSQIEQISAAAAE
jgi:hypothetical protein